MYCKRCRNVIPEGEFICRNCKLDNSKLIDEYKNQELKSFYDVVKNKKKIGIHQISTILISIILIATGIIFLSQTFSKAEIEQPTKTTTGISTFVVDNLNFNVPSTYGTSTNTIFYKVNTDINIKITSIEKDYYNLKTKDKNITDDILNNIKTKKLTTELMYSHYFIKDNKYYELIVNYIDDDSIYTDDVKKDINSIINSIN